MKRTLSFLLVFLLSAQCSVGSVAGDLSLLTDAGQTDSLDRPLVLFSELNDGSVLTVDNEGNVSLNAFTNGVLSTQWSVLLGVEANNARIDAAQELVTVAHDQGVYVVQMSTQSVYWNVSSVDRVDDAAESVPSPLRDAVGVHAGEAVGAVVVALALRPGQRIGRRRRRRRLR